MPSKQVTIQGVMTWDDAGAPGFPSQGPGFPTNPIAPGGTTPPWGPGLSPSPPGVWIPAFPTNPIAPGGPPPQVWPGPGRPDQGLPGQPPGIWPSPGRPDNTLPGQPPGIWGGNLPPMVSNPISGGGYIVGWSPYFGAVFIPIGGAPPVGGSGNYPDQGLPGEQPGPDNTLPGSK
jgi:hypothetical protein